MTTRPVSKSELRWVYVISIVVSLVFQLWLTDLFVEILVHLYSRVPLRFFVFLSLISISEMIAFIALVINSYRGLRRLNSAPEPVSFDIKAIEY